MLHNLRTFFGTSIRELSIYSDHPSLNELRRLWRNTNWRENSGEAFADFFENERDRLERISKMTFVPGEMLMVVEHPRQAEKILAALSKLHAALKNRTQAELLANDACCAIRADGDHQKAHLDYHEAAAWVKREPVLSLSYQMKAAAAVFDLVMSKTDLSEDNRKKAMGEAEQYFIRALGTPRTSLPAAHLQSYLLGRKFKLDYDLAERYEYSRGWVNVIEAWTAENHPDFSTPRLRMGARFRKMSGVVTAIARHKIAAMQGKVPVDATLPGVDSAIEEIRRRRRPMKKSAPQGPGSNSMA